MIEFPKAYNRSGGKFGRIDITKGVKGEEGGRQYETRYRQKQCDFNYSDGFFMPILTAVTILIERAGNRLRWSESPRAFLDRHLDRLMKTYKGLIRNKDYDGRLVGRDPTAYETLSILKDMERLRERNA